MVQLCGVGRLMGSPSGAVSLLPQTLALIAAMTVPPSDARAILINNLMTVIVNNGITGDLFYALCAHDAQAARLNWLAPSSYALLPINGPTFTTDSGYQGDGLSSYLRTQYNASTNAVAFTLNGGSIGISSLTNDNTGMDMGALNSVSTFTQIRNAGIQGGRINNAGTATSVASSSGIGTTILVRDSATTEKIYREGSQVGAATINATGIPNREVIVLGRNNTTPTYGTKKLAAAFQIGTLTGPQAAALTTGIAAYVNAISPGSLP